jgi:enoyl-CoA hydratase/carnithine racemase
MDGEDFVTADPLLDVAGQVVEPVTIVDMDSVSMPVAQPDRLLIGVGTGPLDDRRRELATYLDLTLIPMTVDGGAPCVAVEDPVRAGETLRSAAETNPQAALVLAGVLRAAPSDAVAALNVESFAYSTLLGGPEFAGWLMRRGPRPLPPPLQQPPVLVDRDADTLHVTLNRPERRNAYGREMRDALVEALRLAVLDPSIKKVTLTGAGPAFSAGGDLDEFGTAPDLATAHFIRTSAGAGRLLYELADRVEVHVQGSCVGAGVELPAFADRVVARPGTTFRLPEVRMGLIPGAGGTVSLPRRIGRWRTCYLALSGQPLDAATALEWGLIDAIDFREGGSPVRV